MKVILFLRDLSCALALMKVRRIVSAVYKPQGVEIWLSANNRNLGGNSPLVMILQGHGDLVVAEAERLAAL